MLAATSARERPIDINIHPVSSSSSYEDLAGIVIAETKKQIETMLAKKRILDEDDQEEFRIGCDALNYARVIRRLQEEVPGVADEALQNGVSEVLCGERGYAIDDFQSALEAVEHRVRLPYGLDPLQYAYLQARKKPIRLLDPKLANAELPTTIAGIAYHLQRYLENSPILLPVEQLRKVLQCRKLVVSGALRRLINSNRRILTKIGDKPHTGRAQEFRFLGQEGQDFEFVTPQEMQDAKQRPSSKGELPGVPDLGPED